MNAPDKSSLAAELDAVERERRSLHGGTRLIGWVPDTRNQDTHTHPDRLVLSDRNGKPVHKEQVIRSRDGRLYRIAGDGSLRRIKPNSGGKP